MADECRSQKNRHDVYHLRGDHVVPRGGRGHFDAGQPGGGPQWRVSLVRSFQPTLHDPRHQHDLFRGDAVPDRSDQYRRPLADRCQGRGLSEAQSNQPGSHGGRRISHHDLAAGRGVFDGRVDRVSFVHRSLDQSRSRPGLLHPIHRDFWNRLHPHRGQLCGDHLQDAHGGDEFHEDAAIHLDGPLHLHPADLRHAAAHRLLPHARARPLPRLSLFHERHGREFDELHQPVLDVRSPGGLHPHPSGLRGDVGNRGHLLREASLRLRRAGGGDDVHRGSFVHGLAAPLLHHGAIDHGERRFRHRDAADCHPDGGENL